MTNSFRTTNIPFRYNVYFAWEGKTFTSYVSGQFVASIVNTILTKMRELPTNEKQRTVLSPFLFGSISKWKATCNKLHYKYLKLKITGRTVIPDGILKEKGYVKNSLATTGENNNKSSKIRRHRTEQVRGGSKPDNNYKTKTERL